MHTRLFRLVGHALPPICTSGWPRTRYGSYGAARKTFIERLRRRPRESNGLMIGHTCISSGAY